MKKPEIVQLWKVHSVTDEWGRTGAFVGYFGSASAAKDAARGKGFFGDGEIKEGWGMVVDGKVFALESRDPVSVDVDLVATREKRRLDALAKLTDEEKKALNLI